MEDTPALTVSFSSILYNKKINHSSHTDAGNTYLEHDHQVECPGLNRTVVADLFAILAPNMNTVLLKIWTEVNFKVYTLHGIIRKSHHVIFSLVLPTCQVPMFSTLSPNGLLRLVHSLKASLLISMMLFSKAHKAASGKAEENRTT